jgi:ribosome-binding factor A
MKKNHKYDRLANDVQQVITRVINEEINGLEYVSITQVELTKDLGDAKIFINLLDDSEKEFALAKLKKSEKFIKKRLAEEVKMRRIPNLIFKHDESLGNYNKIDELLAKISVEVRDDE